MRTFMAALLRHIGVVLLCGLPALIDGKGTKNLRKDKDFF
jgi:hypothetical protein